MLLGLRRLAALLLPVLVCAVLVSWRVFDPAGLLYDLRTTSLDYFQRLKPREYTPVPVKIVAIDDRSLEKHGQWPWPRTLAAELVDKLTAAGAAVIAFDVLFAEPDRLSPDNDKVFAAAIQRSGTVVLALARSSESVGTTPRQKALIAWAGEGSFNWLPGSAGVVPPLLQLQADARGLGTISLGSPSRRWGAEIAALDCPGPSACTLGQVFPSLAVEAIRVAQGSRAIRVKTETSGLSNLMVGQSLVPVGPRGQFYLHYTPPKTERYVAAAAVLDGSAPRTAIDGAIVFIGTSATALGDRGYSPLGDVIPGVEIHAQATEQLLLNHFLARPDWMDGAEILVAILLFAVTLGLALALPRWLLPYLALGGAALTVCGAFYLFAGPRMISDPVFLVIAVFAAAGLTPLLRRFWHRPSAILQMA